MFEEMKGFDKILVTGPQRSGTTLCAQIIADELGHKFVPEEDININQVDRLKLLLAEPERMAIQCPGVARWIDEIADENCAVVWMMRNTGDIIESERMIKWDDSVERTAYDAVGIDRPISVIKTEYYFEEQEPVIKNAFVVTYEDLEKSKWWVPLGERKHWGPRQVKR